MPQRPGQCDRRVAPAMQMRYAQGKPESWACLGFIHFLLLLACP